MSASLHPAAGHHVPGFIAGPGETDGVMIGVAIFLLIAVMAVGILFLRLHTLPERMAHRGHKLQMEIVSVLGLLALFTHMHIFWVAGLLLALIDIPDFGTPLRRMATSLEELAGVPFRGSDGLFDDPTSDQDPNITESLSSRGTEPPLASVGAKERAHA